MAARIVFSSLSSRGLKKAVVGCKQSSNNKTLLSTRLGINTSGINSQWLLVRSFSSKPITNNLELITSNKVFRKVDSDKNVKIRKPLVVMLSWLMAKPKDVHKYARFYTDQGYDVLTVSISAWQILWPVTGSQIIAKEIVDYLHNNYLDEPLLLHGFSAGGYLWGEVLVQILEQPKLFTPIVNRFVGQVWDSVADVVELQYGFPQAIFPKNKLMQVVAEKYIRYHMRVFDKVATCHYIRSSQIFHRNMVKAPALFLLSKTDPIGTEESNRKFRDDWETGGIRTYWKCWDKSPHVEHFRKHPVEYVAELTSFLNRLKMDQNDSITLGESCRNKSESEVK